MSPHNSFGTDFPYLTIDNPFPIRQFNNLSPSPQRKMSDLSHMSRQLKPMTSSISCSETLEIEGSSSEWELSLESDLRTSKSEEIVTNMKHRRGRPKRRPLWYNGRQFSDIRSFSAAAFEVKKWNYFHLQTHESSFQEKSYSRGIL